MTPSREYVAVASCLAVWLGQTTAQFSVAYLHTMVPLKHSILYMCQVPVKSGGNSAIGKLGGVHNTAARDIQGEENTVTVKPVR